MGMISFPHAALYRTSHSGCRAGNNMSSLTQVLLLVPLLYISPIHFHISASHTQSSSRLCCVSEFECCYWKLIWIKINNFANNNARKNKTWRPTVAGEATSRVHRFKDEVHVVGHLNNLSAHQTQLLVVVQHGVHVLDPDRVDRTVEYQPIPIRSLSFTHPQ